MSYDWCLATPFQVLRQDCLKGPEPDPEPGCLKGSVLLFLCSPSPPSPAPKSHQPVESKKLWNPSLPKIRKWGMRTPICCLSIPICCHTQPVEEPGQKRGHLWPCSLLVADCPGAVFIGLDECQEWLSWCQGVRWQQWKQQIELCCTDMGRRLE